VKFEFYLDFIWVKFEFESNSNSNSISKLNFKQSVKPLATDGPVSLKA
jgi:hypothetical protein